MTKRRNNKKSKSRNDKQIEKSKLNSLAKKNDLNKEFVVQLTSDRILRSNNKRNMAFSESDSQANVKKRKNDTLESSGLLSTRVTRSKKSNVSLCVDQETQEFSHKKPKKLQCNKIGISTKSSSVSSNQTHFKRNDICFAKLTGHLPWPAQV